MQVEQNPYLVETKNGQILKFSKIDADNEAFIFQQTGKDVEVWYEGILQYKLHGVEQGKLFQEKT
ncbi:MAG: hypothetical protein HOG73_09115 [Candidatus Marinimicrobia bacterium]|nr:hypothetical protein [Candidatus Woesearchaeota archaeon]MBT5995868.1 hypothetical protein [Candidatus Neomarinimicrobiota bacterium]